MRTFFHSINQSLFNVIIMKADQLGSGAIVFIRLKQADCSNYLNHSHLFRCYLIINLIKLIKLIKLINYNYCYYYYTTISFYTNSNYQPTNSTFIFIYSYLIITSASILSKYTIMIINAIFIIPSIICLFSS